MDGEKVVSIEDRIPKLREARRKKSNRRLIFYICLFFSLISIVVYLQSPLSYVNQIHVSGNQYLSEAAIITESELSETVNVWSFKTAKIEEKLEAVSEIKSATVERVFPNNIEIAIEEYRNIAYINEGEFFQPILENGTILDSLKITDYQGDAPLLYQFTDDEYLTLFVEQLANLSESITEHISEVYWTPTESNPFLLELYMTDGFNVIVSIRQFSSQMPSYPSIVSQLEVTNGTIEMGSGGAIFYNNEKDDQDEQESEEERQEDVNEDESEG
ncbi:MAG TPA: FtsQ-type POTRA domain-containing protein [Bacilli bacterium]|nr:FtsQ-type POTRA domain-containing protein [Bacilli bacterium]